MTTAQHETRLVPLCASIAGRAEEEVYKLTATAHHVRAHLERLTRPGPCLVDPPERPVRRVPNVNPALSQPNVVDADSAYRGPLDLLDLFRRETRTSRDTNRRLALPRRPLRAYVPGDGCCVATICKRCRVVSSGSTEVTYIVHPFARSTN